MHRLERRSHLVPLSLGCAAAIVLAASRVWSHSDYLLHADAVNYARALFVFDLEKYSPHPPGYVIFVLLARLVHRWVFDPNQTYLYVNFLMQLVTIATAYALFRRIVGSANALLILGVVIFHPMFWYYGSNVNVYTAEAAATLLVVWALCRHAERDRISMALLLGFLWGVIGGIRQFTLLFMTPLVVWHLRRYRHGRFPQELDHFELE